MKKSSGIESIARPRSAMGKPAVVHGSRLERAALAKHSSLHLSEVRVLPRGTHKLSSDEVVNSQLGRAHSAMVHCAAKKGYSAVTITDICTAAHLSRTTFYQMFRDREECFLSAYMAAHQELVAAVIGGQDLASSPKQRSADALHAYLQYNHKNPAVAKAFLVEIHSAGPRAWAKRDWGHEQFSKMLQKLYALRRLSSPELADIPEEIFLALVAALEEMVCSYIRKGKGDRLMDLMPRAMFLLEACYAASPQVIEMLHRI